MMRFMKASWKKVKNAVKKVASIFTKKRVFQAAYFVTTTAFTALVLTFMLPYWLAAVIMAVVVLHEFGHYIEGWRLGREVSLPFFIPLIWAVLGGTRVKGDSDDPEGTMKIALAGPYVGMAVCALVMAGGLAAGFMPAFWAGGWLMLFQVYNGTFGSDGRRYRRAKREVEAMDLGFTPSFAAAYS